MSKRRKLNSRQVKILREAYFAQWKREWPEDDYYLTELFFEEKTALGYSRTTKKYDVSAVHENVLVAMRSDHQMTEEA
jgi:hypothetical protein